MKILLVHNRYRSSQPSGENAVVSEEAALLRDRGCEVEFVEVESDDIAGFSAAEKALLPARVIWSRGGMALVRAAIRRVRPDIVHFHNTFPLLSPAAVRAAHTARTPIVLTMHNFRPLCANAAFLRDGRVCEECLRLRAPIRALQYGCYRGSRVGSLPLVGMSAVHRSLGTWTGCPDRIIFPSEFARDKYVEAGWPEERLVVKHNTARTVGKVRVGPGEGFVAVARLSVEKGIDVLIDAWREVSSHSRQTLSIIGSGEDEKALRVRASGVDGISFLGSRSYEETRHVVRNARALIVPSRCYEVFPRAIVEAYSSGVPVVASRLGSLGEIVKDGKTGLLFEPESPDGLAEALKRLGNDTELPTELGKRAYELYRDRFAPEPTTQRLLAIYQDAVATRRARGGGEQ
jgi:glycosyltransferase involved in cell wall biosynthesis